MFRQNDGKIRIEGQTAQIPDVQYMYSTLYSQYTLSTGFRP